MTNVELNLSVLPKTWILDIDGTLVKHNGHLKDGYDTALDSSMKFIEKIPSEDMIIIVTSRTEEYRDLTISTLKELGVRYNSIIFGVPNGERIIVNDNKPSGLKMAYAICVRRDEGIDVKIIRDSKL